MVSSLVGQGTNEIHLDGGRRDIELWNFYATDIESMQVPAMSVGFGKVLTHLHCFDFCRQIRRTGEIWPISHTFEQVFSNCSDGSDGRYKEAARSSQTLFSASK